MQHLALPGQEERQMQSEQFIGIFHIGFIVCLVLSVIFAGLSLFFFFKFKIRDVFNFLTGRAQRRTIQKMEEENAQTGKLRQDTFIPESTGDLYKTPSGSIPPIIYPPTGEMATGGDPTEKMHTGASQTQPHVQAQGGGSLNTGGGYSAGTGSAIREDEKTELLPDGSEVTTLLNGDGSEETTLLNGGSEETMLLGGNAAGMQGSSADEKTEILNNGGPADNDATVPQYGAQGETMLLTPELERAMQEERQKKPYSGRFKIVKDMMLIHTEERI